jgi:hypothetical protein
MFAYLISIFFAYIIGGITFIPILLLFYYYYYHPMFIQGKSSTVSKPTELTSDTLEQDFYKDTEANHNQFYKVGWLHVTRGTPVIGKGASIGGIVKSYLSGTGGKSTSSTTTATTITNKPVATASLYEETHASLSTSPNSSSSPPSISGVHFDQNSHTPISFHYFAVLKFNTLYLYDSELQLDCKGIINVSQHSVHIYPYGLKDHELFSKVNRIQLRKKDRKLFAEDDYYFNCSRCVDKEDWYLALMKASKLDTLHGEPPSQDLQNCLHNTTHFDQDAMNHLISTIHSDPSHFEMQWFNALLGRIFLGIYKTESTRSFFYNKILSKIDKLNARRPPFLEEISLRSVEGGHGPPQITQPRLIHLSPQGEYTGDVHVFYDGHFRVELETVLTWKYSDRLPPIRIDLILAITLKSIEGKMRIKIKEPPTNRAWMGFYKKPKMEWIVEPVVWEKRIGYSVVSKAIQTKIEEIFTETMVLPNMDDIVFFQAGGVGGIFGKEDTLSNKGPMDVTSLSYQSLPELYSAPSKVVVTADPFPLLSTGVSSTVSPIPPLKKRWFKRKELDQSNAAMTSDTDTVVSELDTPSQKTLKSVIISSNHTNPKPTHSKSSSKRKKSLIITTGKSRQQFLASNVDHSVLGFQNKVLPQHAGETPTIENPNDAIWHEIDNKERVNTQNALHSVRLSKKMLSLSDQRNQQVGSTSRLRSKSLPSTGLSEINVIQDIDNLKK